MSGGQPADWFALIDRYGGIIACLLTFIWGLTRGWWVLGREYERADQENRDLKAQAKLDAETIQKSVHTTWQMVGTVRESATSRPSP
jgi:hypothetical protein